MQSHHVLIFVAVEIVLIEVHFVGILIYFILVFVVEAEVVKKIDKQLSGVFLIPLSNAGKQHNHESVSFEPSIFWLAEFVVIREVLDNIENGLQNGIMFFLL